MASRFDDLTGLDAASRYLSPGDRCAMVLAGHHQPLRVWVRFHTRCPMSQGVCRTDKPAWRRVGASMVACHFAEAVTPA